MLTTFLMDIKDFRRPQAQKYKLHDVILFSIIAILCNAKSYRDIHRFIKVHFEDLIKDFSLSWVKPPAYTTIRNIIKGIDSLELEAAFRAYTQSLVNYYKNDEQWLQIAIDGKTLCKSFDHFNDKKALQKLMFFDVNEQLILGHIPISEKTNEIPAVQSLLEKLELTKVVYTMDAMHCQKKLLTLPVKIKYCWCNLKTIKNCCCRMLKALPKACPHAIPTWLKPKPGMAA